MSNIFTLPLNPNVTVVVDPSQTKGHTTITIDSIDQAIRSQIETYVPTETKPLNTLQAHYPEQYGVASQILILIQAGAEHICLRNAQVKSGKRTTKNIIASLSRTIRHREFTCAYMTALNRKDIRDQFKDLERYGVLTPATIRKNGLESLRDKLYESLNIGKSVIVFIDELDYGSGDTQILSRILEPLSRKDKVHFIYFSATPEEILESKLAAAGTLQIIDVSLNPKYRGAAHYLDSGLAKEAEQLWDYTNNAPTAHFKVVMSVPSSKPIHVFRITGKQSGNAKSNYATVKNSAAFKNFLMGECGFNKILYIDKDNGLDWEDGWKSIELDWRHDPNYKIALILNQTCTRSTEIRFHPLIELWHDYREDSDYNTMIQALGRVFHYYNEKFENSIRLYGDLSVLKVHCGRLDPEIYVGDISSRVRKGGNRRNRFICEREVFPGDVSLTVEDVQRAYETHNALHLFDPSKKGIKGLNFSKNNTINLVDAALKGILRSTFGDNTCFYFLDRLPENPEQWQLDAWERLSKEKPEWVGKKILIVPVERIKPEGLETVNSYYNVCAC